MGQVVSDSVASQVVTTYTTYLPIIYKDYPPVPVLNSIPMPVGGLYTITWDCDSTYVDYYHLQQAYDDDFTQGAEIYTVTAGFRPFDRASLNTWYYRVRAVGDWGEGAWSNVKSVSTGFSDNFDDDDSGWLDESKTIFTKKDGTVVKWRRDYKDNQYRLKVDQGGPLAWFWQPAAWAPYKPRTDKYCIETKVKFKEGNYAANMGVILGSSDDDKDEMKLYALCLSRDNDDGLGWFLMYKDNYKFPDKDPEKPSKRRGGCAKPTEKFEGFVKEGGKVRDGTSREDWNKVQLGVNGDKVKVYIGDHYKGEAGDKKEEKKVLSGLSNMKYVGVIGGTYEMTPIEIRYEYFRVILNSDCSER
jgi:hypothetical protein